MAAAASAEPRLEEILKQNTTSPDGAGEPSISESSAPSGAAALSPTQGGRQTNRLGVELPKDYTDFLKEHDGGEGFVCDNYIIFFKAEEFVDFKREYEVEKYAPGILLFASNGGGEGYGFDTEDPVMPIVRIPFIGMNRQSAETIARDLPICFLGWRTENER